MNIPFDNPELGLFSKRKREEYNRGTLDQNWIDVLNELGFEWKYRKKKINENTFQLRMDQLRQFKQEHGHLKIPVTYPEIGTFAATVRGKYRNGTLSQPYKYALNELGFVWDNQHEKSFDEIVAELKEFRKEHGHLMIPLSHPNLGRFVKNTIGKYRYGSLNKEHFLILNDLGFVWGENERNALNLKDRMEQLRNYKEKNGHLNIPNQGSALEYFAQNTRKKYQKGQLEQEWIDALNELGFVWKYQKIRNLGNTEKG